MTVQISQTRPARDRARHLRITVQIEEARLDLVSAIVVNEPLDPPKATIGLWVYEWREDGDTVWWDTMADPLAQRGIARPKEREHSFGQRRRGDFTVRVPIDEGGARRRLELRVYRSASALPEDPEAVRRLISGESPRQLELVATLADDSFKRHPEWASVQAALGMVKRERE